MTLLFTPLDGLKTVTAIDASFEAMVATPGGFKTAPLGLIKTFISAPLETRLRALESRQGNGGVTLTLQGMVEGQVIFTGAQTLELQTLIPDDRLPMSVVQGLSATLGTVNQRLSVLENAPPPTADLQPLNEALSDQDTRLTATEQQLGEADTRLGQVEAQLSAQSAQVQTLQTQMGSVEGQLSDQALRLQTLEGQSGYDDTELRGRVESLETSTGTQFSGIHQTQSDIQTQLTDHETRLEALETAPGYDDSRLSGLIAGLQTDVVRLDNQDQTASTRLQAVEDAQGALETRVDTLEATVAGLQGGGGAVESASFIYVTQNTVMQPGGQYIADARNGTLTLTVPSGLSAGQGCLVKAFGGQVVIARGTHVFAVQGMGPTDDLGLADGQKVAIASIGNNELIVI